MKGRLVVISGPSGVGKSTICNELANRLDNVYLSVSTTTRQIKAGEQNGREYWFVSRDQFEKQMRAGNFLEHAEVFGNLYGTQKDKVLQMLGRGKVVLLEIDVQGAQQIKKLYPQAELIFILPPKQMELQRRINNRGRDDEKDVEKRLEGAGTEIAAAWQHYKYLVINDNLQRAVQEIIEIITKPLE